ncbi:MAG: PD40 domain-containing protein [Candidatus Dadabacteria bacterium]|nr:PD40 domain-containing protein [Candidatus Dadabacteria bacterium]
MGNKIQSLLLCSFLLAAYFSIETLLAQIPIPDIDRPILKKVSIVIPELRPSHGSYKDSRAREFIEVVRGDLRNSGLFEVLTDGFTGSRVDIDRLFDAGIDASLDGEYKSMEDRVLVSVKLISISQEKMLLGRSYEASPGRIREAAHRFSNLVIKELTGIDGFFTSKIVFVSGRSPKRDLYIMDYDGRNRHRLTNHASLLLSPHCNSNGTRVVFNSDKVWDQDIYVLNLVPTVSEKRLTRALRLEQSPEWSPDGTKIAFSANSNIYVANADGTNPRKLTRSSAIDVSPTWSPDGRRIAFASDRAGSPKIYVMNSDGTGLKLLTFREYNTDPAWSPNPEVNKIAFVRLEGSEVNIFTINPDGTGLQRLTQGVGRNENPAWSPDGHYIAFSSTRKGPKDIYSMYLNGANQVPLSTGGAKSFPTWCK